MKETLKYKLFMLGSPLFVLLFARAGVELSLLGFQHEVAWIPSFIGYYIAIGIVVYYAAKRFSINIFSILILIAGWEKIFIEKRFAA